MVAFRVDFIWSVLHAIVKTRLTTIKYKARNFECFGRFQNASRFRDETRSVNSPEKFATPEGNSKKKLATSEGNQKLATPEGNSLTQCVCERGMGRKSVCEREIEEECVCVRESVREKDRERDSAAERSREGGCTPSAK